MQEQDGGGKEGGERMVWLDWFVVDIAIVGEARCSPHVFAFFGGGYFFFIFVVFLPKTIAFLPVIPVAPNTVIVWDPCDERPPKPVDALGRAKAARKVLRNAIVMERGGKRINLEDPCLLAIVL